MADKSNKKRSGLHKEISSIFDGVPVPNDRAAARPHTGSEQGQAGYDSPRPLARPPQNPQIPGPFQRIMTGAATQPKGAEAAAAVSAGPLQEAVKKLFAAKPGVSPLRQKVMALLVPVLFVALVFLLSRTFDISLFKGKTVKPPKPVTPVGVVTTGKIAWQKPDPYPTGLRDPMQLTAAMAAQIKVETQPDASTGAKPPTGGQTTDPQATVAEDLTIKGILFSDDNPSAVVGTRIAHVGDVIAGAKILRINKKSVEFERDGQIWTQAVEP